MSSGSRLVGRGAAVTEHQQRLIVRLGRVSDELQDVGGNRGHCGLRARVLTPSLERRRQSIVAEQFVRRGRGFGNAVGEEHERIPGRELPRPLAERILLEDSEYRPAEHRQRRRRSARGYMVRRVVAAVGVGQRPGPYVNARAEHGDEQRRGVVDAEVAVELGQQRARRHPATHRRPEQRQRDRHEQRCRHTLARHVADDDIQLLIVEEHEVVEVAADLLGRHDHRVQIELRPVRERRKDLGQDAHLDVVRDPQLAFNPLLGRRRDRQLLDRAREPLGHLVERSGELADFVGRRHFDAAAQIAVGDP